MFKDISYEMKSLLNSTNDAIIAIDKNEKIVIFNKASENITGFIESEVIGENVRDIIEETRLPFVLKSEIPELNKRQFIKDTIIITSRIPIKNDKGIIVGAVAIFRDISEISDLTEEIYELKEMQGLLRAIFNSTQDAISVCDEKGKVVMINPAYTRLTGLKAEDIIDKHTSYDIVEGNSLHLKVIESSKEVSRERLVVGKLKKEVISSAAPIIVDGKLKGSVAVLHDVTDIKSLTDELTEARKLIRKLEAKYTFDDIIGEDEIMIQTLEKGKRASVTPTTVLLRGESGTGKELFAHAIHNLSDRKYNQFVRVNCAAINENLLESELFGYEEGAFSGAKKGGKKGYFEEAHGGTIFLDEIGEIPMSTQVKLLRVLQEKEIMKVGGTKTISINVRIIAATNAYLEDAIRKKTFREDLYYRLNVFPIEIPPLRERKNDLYPLIMSLIKNFNLEYGRNVESISKDALDYLKSYNWPGNVRELQNFIGRTLINIKYNEKVILKDHLPQFFDNEKKQRKNEIIEMNEGLTLKKQMETIEKDLIKKILVKNNYEKRKTAKQLDISERNLYYKIKKYKLDTV